MRVVLKVDNDILISDLMVKLGQIRELNIELPSRNTELIFYKKSDKGHIIGMLFPNAKLSQLHSVGQDLMAAECLTR